MMRKLDRQAELLDTDGSSGPRAGGASNLLFVILAHDAPDAVAQLAASLVSAGSQATVWVHFDAGAPAEAHTSLRSAVQACPRIHVVSAPCTCRWGDISLVTAVFRTLSEARASGAKFDFAILLSGSCLPCRPVRQLERFLADSREREFVEVGDGGWIRDGLREERYELYFYLRPMRRRWADRLSVRAQRWLGVKRKFPSPLKPRFGSQWWALTWRTCETLLDFMAARPDLMRFFGSTWIPDELVIPTLVHHLVPPERIAGFTLTHYQFTRRGKPVVYYDDHLEYVMGLDRFFVRKVSPEATALRARCLARAAEPDDGAPLERIGRANDDYTVKTRAQTWYPQPGQIFYRSQFVDQSSTVLDTLPTSYIVVLAPAWMATAILDELRPPSFAPLGRVFAADRVDLGSDRLELAGVRSGDVALRDLHPALFLARLRQHCEGVPVLACAPFERAAPLEAILDDPAALKIACLPMTARPHQLLRQLLALGDGDLIAFTHRTPFAHPHWTDAALSTKLTADAEARLSRLTTTIHTASPQVIRMPLPRPAGGDTAWQHGIFKSSLEVCSFRGEAWFDELADGLERAWAQQPDEQRRRGRLSRLGQA